MDFTFTKLCCECSKKYWFIVILYTGAILFPITASANDFKVNRVCSGTKKTNGDCIIINVKYKEAQPGDTLTLIIDNILFRSDEQFNLGSYKVVSKDKWYSFKVPVDEPSGYFSLTRSCTFTNKGQQSSTFYLLSHLFWEKGDQITISLSNKETYAGVYSTCIFSGEGSKKYRVRYQLDSIAKTFNSGVIKPAFDDNFRYVEYGGLEKAGKLDFLEKERTGMSDLSYQVLKADICFESPRLQMDLINRYYDKYVRSAPESIKGKFVKNYKAAFDNPNKYSIDTNALSKSFNYIHYLYYKVWYESYFLHGHYDPDWIYHRIKEITSGTSRDEAMVIFFQEALKSSNINRYFEDAINHVTNRNCLNIMHQLIANGPGNKFENFELPDSNNKMIKLSQFSGKKVIIDFWFIGCGGCAALYQNTLSKVEGKFKNDSNVVFISICADISRKLLIKGIKSNEYTSSGAVNLYTNGQGYKHPLLLKYNIESFPFVIVLDRNGIIKYLNSSNLANYNSLCSAINLIP